jgi:hypothetical protein
MGGCGGSDGSVRVAVGRGEWGWGAHDSDDAGKEEENAVGKAASGVDLFLLQ